VLLKTIGDGFLFFLPEELVKWPKRRSHPQSSVLTRLGIASLKPFLCPMNSRAWCWRVLKSGIVSLVLILLPPTHIAMAGETWWTEKQNFTPSYNDFGATGLLQLPTARMQADGQLNVGWSNIQPYRRYVMNLQALPWLETGFRITQVLNRIEPSSVFFGDEQNFFDRGIDAKIRLWSESRFRPAAAFGVRDLGGTNLFGSEYLVFSRRHYNIDMTGGIAWGNFGSRGHLPNPLTIFGESINSREGDNRAGSFNPRFLRGEKIGLFAGVEYITPNPKVRLKLEYDSNSYQQEPLNNPLDVRTPLNAGVEYRPRPWLHLTAGVERGNNLLLRSTISQSLTKTAEVPKFLDPPAEPITVRPPARPVLPLDAPEWQRPCSLLEETTIAGEWVKVSGHTYTVHLQTLCRPSRAWLAAEFRRLLADAAPRVKTVALYALAGGMAAGPAYVPYQTLPDTKTLFDGFQADYQQRLRQGKTLEQTTSTALFAALKKAGFPVRGLRFQEQTLSVWLEQNTFRSTPKGLGRAARIIANRSPGDVDFIRLHVLRRGLDVADVTFRRRDLEKGGQIVGGQKSPGETWHQATLSAPLASGTEESPTHTPPWFYPRSSFNITPAFRQNIGGPDKYYVFQIYAAANATVELAKGLHVGGSYGIDLYNNFDEIQLQSNSALPKVRTDLKNYLQQGTTGLFSLDTNYFFNLRPNWYGKVSAGLFEPMFGGAGGEVLYAPYEERWALGGEFYYAKQRDFDLSLGFRDYDTTTGHLSAYYKLPVYNLVSQLNVGRYLAGDDGATLEISRQFDSGVAVGVFATLTDVPFEKFGEGSFDKGFYLNIPLDMFLARSSTQRRSLGFRPVTRDGGARLDVGSRLYPMVDAVRRPTLERDWREVFE
jgi:hypothetical protein